MSYREYLQIHYRVDIEKYLTVLRTEFNVRANPRERGSFVIDDPPLPFYKPKQLDEYVSILGFNYAPLSSLLIRALIYHPELAPKTTFVRWMAEQDVLAQGTLKALQRKFRRRR